MKTASKFIEEYIAAIDYLDIPMLLNTVARFLVKNNMITQIKLPSTVLPYIKKHQVLGNFPEKTVADYIALNPSDPKLIGPELIWDALGLTSLFGIEQLNKPATITELHIIENNILDPEDDPDFPTEPLKNMINLKTFALQINKNLKSLPKTLFRGLKNIDTIFLDKNQLTSLPKDLFKGLSNLTLIILDNNKLTDLPDGIFNELEGKNAGIAMVHNNFSDEKKKAIKDANPTIRIVI